MNVIDKLSRFFNQRKCWNCKYKYSKSEMLSFIGGYVCQDCYRQLKQRFAINNIRIKEVFK